MNQAVAKNLVLNTNADLKNHYTPTVDEQLSKWA